jgi:asparagine synthase (glutamine-hydrolysing)
MSGICGQFNLDDSPVAAADLRAMTAVLGKRGPERTGRWHDGPASLGHTLLATTPELRSERQPFTHAETGCVITADVRLDNRDELLSAIGLLEQNDSIGDAEIILRSYLNWGEDCLDRFLGDFAFAIWDPRHRLLFCARDHFGMRPFYYHHVSEKHFIFASDARAILVLPQVPYKISHGRIADFLVPGLEWIDYTSTFFDEVYRLPPGHKVIVTPTALNTLEYWKPEPGPELAEMSDEDYAQGFLEVFTQAVEARLRTPAGTIGSMLSGGMDSGSIVAVGKDILSACNDEPLHTFSCARHRGVDCAESQAIYSATSIPLISPTLIYPDGLKKNFEVLISGNEEPFDGECTLLKAIYLEARAQDRYVILDGAAGDIVLNEASYIVRLLRNGQLKLALSEIAAENKLWGEAPVASDLLQYARTAFFPELVKTGLRKLRHPWRVERSLNESLISREFADNVGIEQRIKRQREMFPREWTPDYAVETCNAIRPNIAGGRERYARIAAAATAEARDPFLDKRVVEYCSQLPGRLRMRNGWYKSILREAMAGKLPDDVRWARGKPHLGWLFNATLTRGAAERGQLEIQNLQATLSEYVDAENLTNAWRDFHEGGDAEKIHTAHVLSVWLRENSNRPVAPL